MSTFEAMAEGPRARRRTFLPFPGARYNVEEAKWEGPGLEFDVVALGEAEYTRVVKGARGFALKEGVEDPKAGDELYERGLMAHTLAIACVDKDVTDTESPFFPGGVEQIHASRTMTPEIVAYLYEVQQLHQDLVNPLVKNLTPVEYMSALLKTAGGDPSFFVSSRPATQWSFTHTLASQLLASTMRESASGGSSGAAPPTTDG